MSWVERAIAALKSVGSPIASSKELVCSDCVPPITAAIASTVVRIRLLYGSCSVRLHPLVWQWVRSMSERGFSGEKCFPSASPTAAAPRARTRRGVVG